MGYKKKFKSFVGVFLHGLFRFCVYGILFIFLEIIFYSSIKIGRQIPIVKYFFTFNWKVDDSLQLNHIWDVPAYTLFGQASLYMFFVYGIICVLGLEPMSRVLRKRNLFFVVRAFIYMNVILVMECACGWILYWITGLKIWYYDDWGSWPVFTTFAIAPMWYICGILTEIVINYFDTVENIKRTVYGLGNNFVEKNKNGNKVAVISDAHISFSDRTKSSWFMGKNLGSLTVILNNIAMDENTNRLIINGDFFDIWLCPINQKPFSSFTQLIEHWKYSPFMIALRSCIELCDEVWYIPGNHDQNITQEDLNLIVSESGKTMKLKKPGTFEAEQIFKNTKKKCQFYFENGYKADLFNLFENEIDGELFGFSFEYFITRLTSQYSYKKSKKIYKEIIRLIKKSSEYKEYVLYKKEDNNCELAELVVRTFIDVLVEKLNSSADFKEKIDDSSVIIMPEGYNNITIGELKSKYSELYRRKLEQNESKQIIFAEKRPLIAIDSNSLNDYARENFGQKNVRFVPRNILGIYKPKKIVVMSHTHSAKKDNFLRNEIYGYYVNTGSICECGIEKSPTWIELVDTKCHGFSVKINKVKIL